MLTIRSATYPPVLSLAPMTCPPAMPPPPSSSDQQSGQVLAQVLLVLAVGVPLAVPVAGGAHEPAARLDQAPGQQHTLPHPVAAVGVADLVGLPGKVEGLLDVRRPEHRQRLA